MPSERILQRIAAARGDGRLAAALRQDAPHFDRLSTGEAERLRGRILAAFAESGIPDEALPALREELRTSLSPVVLAGAARALRSLDTLDEEWRSLLEAAAERIVLRDAPVSFADGESSTGGAEIGATLDHFPAARHHCCAGTAAAASITEPPRFALSAAALSSVVLEDQAGAPLRLVERLRGRTSLVAFFYTRCMNPAKCSLTITRLATLARAGEGPDILAISYDGPFDDPARLRRYGSDRGFSFGERARLLRCRTGWPAVRRAFGLRVGYGAATVNEHAREVFLVDPDLQATGLDADVLADPAAVTRRAAEVAAGGMG